MTTVLSLRLKARSEVLEELSCLKSPLVRVIFFLNDFWIDEFLFWTSLFPVSM